jgi:transcriptional regulator with XRE-family HTH domain
MNEEKLKKLFAARLYEIRIQNELSQEKLGKMIGISKFAISKIENAVHGPRFVTIAALCTAFNVSPTYFFESKNIND